MYIFFKTQCECIFKVDFQMKDFIKYTNNLISMLETQTCKKNMNN